MEITKEQKFNQKLFPFYKMVSWDLLFYHSIIFLFLTTVKGLTASEVLLTDAFYPAFKLLSQFFVIGIIDKLDFRKSIDEDNIIDPFTEYERKFMRNNQRIYRAIWRKQNVK